MPRVAAKPKPPVVNNYRIMIAAIKTMTLREREIWLDKISKTSGKTIKFIGASVIDYDLYDALIRGK